MLRPLTQEQERNDLPRPLLPPVVSTSKIPRDADRVAILLNPKAGATAAGPVPSDWPNCSASRLSRPSCSPIVPPPPAQTNRWHAEGCLRALVGVGGDGTAADLVNRTKEGVPLVLLAAGNSNLLARYFRLSTDPEALCRTIVDGVAARVDAGVANDRIFLLMAGCGFDADVVHRLHQRRTGHASTRNYFPPIAEAIRGYSFPEIRVHCEEAGEGPAELSARWLFVFNLPCYGGGFRLARPRPTVPTACWTCAASVAGTFGAAWRSRRPRWSAATSTWPIGPCGACGVCGSPQECKCRINSTAIRRILAGGYSSAPRPIDVNRARRGGARAMTAPCQMVIVTDGHNDPNTAKTAVCLIRYRPDEVVAVLDRQSAGKTCQEVFGVGGRIPCVRSLAETPDANTFVIGIAPPGGRIPPHWRPIILEAITRKMTIVSGLHELLRDDPEFSRAAAVYGVRLVDVRDNRNATWPAAWASAKGASASTPSATIAVAARWWPASRSPMD